MNAWSTCQFLPRWLKSRIHGEVTDPLAPDLQAAISGLQQCHSSGLHFEQMHQRPGSKFHLSEDPVERLSMTGDEVYTSCDHHAYTVCSIHV